MNPASADGQAWFSMWSGKTVVEDSLTLVSLTQSYSFGSCNEPLFMYLIILNYILDITNDTSYKLWILLGFPKEY